jgi:hypothetical protein
MKRILFALAGAALACAAPAAAHHSFAMFDNTKQVEVTGTVKDFQYTNPHSWIIVLVPAADGSNVEWGFEAEGPSTLLRSGIKKSSVTAGDKVVARAFPMRDGRPAGALISLKKADGSMITFRGGPPPPGVIAPK